MRYLPTLQVSRYCLLALQGGVYLPALFLSVICRHPVCLWPSPAESTGWSPHDQAARLSLRAPHPEITS